MALAAVNPREKTRERAANGESNLGGGKKNLAMTGSRRETIAPSAADGSKKQKVALKKTKKKKKAVQ